MHSMVFKAFGFGRDAEVPKLSVRCPPFMLKIYLGVQEHPKPNL